MDSTRRDLLLTAGSLGLATTVGGTAVAATATVKPQQPAVPASDTKIVLLGTKGGPRVIKGRSNPANLVVVSGTPYLIDCGYGVTRQLIEAGIDLQQIRNIFLTNCLADRMMELGPLLYSAWTDGLVEPVHVWGPPPLKRALRSYFQSISHDIDLRIDQERRPDLVQLVKVHEFDRSGQVTQVDGIKVSAVKVRHPPLLNAFGYRFDTPTRSVVFSGATAYSPELIAFARSAEVLVHEVMHLGGLDRMVARLPKAPEFRKRLLGSHTTTAEVGKVAAEAEVRTLVLTQFVPGDDASITEDMWAADVKKSSFLGKVIVGRDLMTV
jgi:ribonuclease BN (tRNA processing enzyme)